MLHPIELSVLILLNRIGIKKMDTEVLDLLLSVMGWYMQNLITELFSSSNIARRFVVSIFDFKAFFMKQDINMAIVHHYSASRIGSKEVQNFSSKHESLIYPKRSIEVVQRLPPEHAYRHTKVIYLFLDKKHP